MAVEQETRSISKQREHQLRFPERQQARASVREAIKRGDLVSPNGLACNDCGKPATEYDHYLGYAFEHWLDVQPVCRPCHSKRPRSKRYDSRSVRPEAALEARVHAAPKKVRRNVGPVTPEVSALGRQLAALRPVREVTCRLCGARVLGQGRRQYCDSEACRRALKRESWHRHHGSAAARPRRRLPLAVELTGSDPDFTGGLSTEEHLRRLRGGGDD